MPLIKYLKGTFDSSPGAIRRVSNNDARALVAIGVAQYVQGDSEYIAPVITEGSFYIPEKYKQEEKKNIAEDVTLVFDLEDYADECEAPAVEVKEEPKKQPKRGRPAKK